MQRRITDMTKYFQKVIMFIWLLPLLMFQCSLSDAAPAEYPKYEVTIASNHDGDSLRLASPIMWPVSAVRVRGVDTPEIGWRARCPDEEAKAEAAQTFVADHLATAQHVILSYIELDKYGRLAAKVDLDGHDLADMLIKAGLGRPYKGDKRLPWCNK